VNASPTQKVAAVAWSRERTAFKSVNIVLTSAQSLSLADFVGTCRRSCDTRAAWRPEPRWARRDLIRPATARETSRNNRTG
jgi:hypothetical protein